MKQRVTDLWTGYEHHAGRWYAMYCNVDLDQSERNKRDDLVWVRNNEVATAAAEIASLRAFVGNNMLRSDYQTVDHMRAEIASLRAKLAAVCEAVEEFLFTECVDGVDAPQLRAALAAAREGKE